MTQPPPGGDTYNLSGDFRGAILNIKSTINGQPRETRIPWQRPPRAEHFTGRETELAQLLAELQPGRVATLCGPGGIGKSALAAEAVWRLAPDDCPSDRFPDGFIFHSFYNQPQADLALAHIARSYGEEPGQGSLRDAALRALAGRQALLILDGTEAADDLGAVLSIRGNCAALVTSRRREDAVAGRQDIKPLPSEEAIHLLQAWGKQQASEPKIADKICELVGRYLDTSGELAREYLTWLEQTPLQALDQGDRREQSVSLLLARSLDQVSETARQVLAVAGLLALAPFRREVAGVALALPEADLHRALAHLVNYGLLERTEAGTYQAGHALIHTYAREQLSPPAEAAAHLAAYYETFVREQTQQGLAGYTRLDAERGHIIRLLTGCVEGADWAAARRLVWAVDSYLNIRGYSTERVTVLNIGVEAARALGYRDNEAAFLGHLGVAHRALGQVEKAIEYHEQALAISREIGYRQGEGAHLGNLGNTYSILGQVEKAIEYYEQALAISREINDRQGEGARLGNLGLAYSDLGQVEKAIEYYEQALAVSREINDRQGEGAHLGNLGSAYYVLGQVEKAVKYYEQALAISREIGYRQGEGARLGNLGLAYYVLGQVEKAIEYHQQALAINREIGHRQGEAANLDALGLAYHDLGQIEKAIEYYQQALAINREIGYRQGEATDLGNLGLAYRDLGQGKARQYLSQALAIFEEIKSPNADRIREWLRQLAGDRLP